MSIIPVSQNGKLYWEKLPTNFVKTCLLSPNEHCKSVVGEMCCLLSVVVFVQLLVSLQSLCLSSPEENSRILCCQAADLQVLSAAGHVFSHHVTTFKRVSVASRVGTCIRPPDPLQSAPCSLSYQTLILYMTSSLSLQVFLLQTETDPVFYSRHLDKNRNTANKHVKHILDV